MKEIKETKEQALDELCTNVKELSQCGEYQKCTEMICQAMGNYPDAPHPHNLMGVVLEKTGKHALAMRHFRAAWALDPAYRPANQNLATYGTFYSHGKAVYDESDCG